MRVERQKEFAQLGKALVTKVFRQAKRKLSKDQLVPCLAYFNLRSDDELYARVGEG